MIDRIEHGDVLELRLNRPPANALSPELITELLETVQGLEAPGAGAAVLSGSPGLFSGGLDVPNLLERSRDQLAETWHQFSHLMRALAVSPVPIAAAITGHSPAGGAVLAIHCDRRVMAEGRFQIGLNEVRVGLPMPVNIHATVRRLVGARQAERLCVGGLLISPDEAAKIGLVDELAPVEEVVPRAVAWCQSLLKLPRHAMLESRAVARRDLAEIYADGESFDISLLVDRWFSEETQGAMRALVASLEARKA